MPEYCSHNQSGAPHKSLTQEAGLNLSNPQNGPTGALTCGPEPRSSPRLALTAGETDLLSVDGRESARLCVVLADTNENFINLPALLFSCKYRVTVHTLDAKRRSKDESVSFLTPSCATLRSKSVKPIACPGDTTPTKVLVKPENLTATFSFHDGNVTARFLWRVTRVQPQQPVTGFQVTWAEVSSASRPNSLPNSIISQSQILPPDHNLLVVSNLRPATFYRNSSSSSAAVSEVFSGETLKQSEDATRRAANRSFRQTRNRRYSASALNASLKHYGFHCNNFDE
ncbi:Anosmin-1 [Labeo rohita]|uniref:Anosmin-1 n=1 Tax=Labeo rohita TaxID=84645 RepID=A0ABQ8MEH3_LABRO|nr:Anosmin-1 [Labeo rohita]